MSAGRLLMVDDSPTVRKLIELTFARGAWEVEYATTGGQAIESAKQNPPDVILLDFVLPDMRGLDVCEALSLSDRTRHVPIVVMSGKGVQVAQLFNGQASFHKAIGKPSTSEEIRAAVESAAAARGHMPDAPRSVGTFQQREAAAKAIYALLREPLAQIPRLISELGSQPAAPFFARKLLSPELMGRMLAAIAPYASVSPAPKSQTGDDPSDASFRGTVRGWSLAGLINFLEASGRTGELSLVIHGLTTLLYIRAGEIILITNRSPEAYVQSVPSISAQVKLATPGAMSAAQIEQQASGTPVLVTLAAVGHFPLAELTEALRTLGRKLLHDVLQASDAEFAFHDLPVLPSYVQAHGRHISLSRTVSPFGSEEGPTVESINEKQLVLARLRQHPEDTMANPEQVFMREAGFSTKIQSFDLTTNERRVLAMVDGISPAGRMAMRSGILPEEALATLGRLAEIRLLRIADTAAGRDTSRPLMILEPDVDGVKSPLASLLENRAVPVRLLDLSGEMDIAAAVQRERPQAVLLSASIASSLEAARRIRALAKLSDVVLVGLLDPHMTDRTQELLAAGFDTTLTKPIAFSEIERLLQ